MYSDSLLFKTLLIVIKSNHLVNRVEHLSDGIAGVIIGRIDLDQSLVQDECLVNFTLHALDLGKQLHSLKAVFVVLILQDLCERLFDRVETAIQVVNFRKAKQGCEIVRIDLHSLEVELHGTFVVLSLVENLAHNESKVAAQQIYFTAEGR